MEGTGKQMLHCSLESTSLLRSLVLYRAGAVHPLFLWQTLMVKAASEEVTGPDYCCPAFRSLLKYKIQQGWSEISSLHEMGYYTFKEMRTERQNPRRTIILYYSI